ncbi:9210_t:CDS:1, partial [Racocetra persica]
IVKPNAPEKNKYEAFVKPQELCEIGSTNETSEKLAKDIQGELEHSSNFVKENDLDKKNILG